MGRTAAGVAGMSVPAGRHIVSLSVVASGEDDGSVMTIAADGTVWHTPLSDYARKGRGGKGVQAGRAPLLWCGAATDLHVGGATPTVLRPVDVPITKRTARGTALGTPVAGPVVAETIDEGEA